MSIYIKNADGSFTLATDTDLEVRGYVSTQELEPVPQLEDGEVRLTITNFNADHKVKTIKIIRGSISEFYGKKTYPTKPTTFKVTPPTQPSADYDENPFGLKHIKHFVEGLCEITVHTDCYSQIVSDLGSGYKCTFNMVYVKGSNNLERLQEHRAKLKEELRKTDDMIAYQLYS